MLLKKYNKLLFFFKKSIFFTTYKMESLSLEEKNIIKDIRNVFILKKEQSETSIEKLRKLFGLKNEIKDIVLWYINNLFEYKKEEENYYKPVKLL